MTTWLRRGAWAGFGAAAGFAAVVFGVVGLVVGSLLFATLARGRDPAAAIAAAALAPLWVAYANRGGPGTVCRQIANGAACDSRLNPWPWVALALALVVTAVVVDRRRRSAFES